MEDTPLDTVAVHLHLTKQASDLLEKYASKRKRGEFVSDLVVAYHLADKKGGTDALEMLRRQALAAQSEASRLNSAYNKAREVYQMAGIHSAADNASKKRR